MITARNISAKKHSRFQWRFRKCPAGIRCGGPGGNAVVAERAELTDEFEIPIERGLLAKQSRAQRMPRLIRRAAGIGGILRGNAEVIKVCHQSGDEGKRTSDIAAPKRSRLFAPVIE